MRADNAAAGSLAQGVRRSSPASGTSDRKVATLP
jgi:hypothetical protein